MKKPTQSKTIWVNSLLLAMTAGIAAYESYIPFLQTVLPGDAILWVLGFFVLNNVANIALRVITTESIR